MRHSKSVFGVAALALMSLASMPFAEAASSVKPATPAKTSTPGKSTTTNSGNGSSSRINQTTKPDPAPSCSRGFRWCPSRRGGGICMIGKCPTLN